MEGEEQPLRNRVEPDQGMSVNAGVSASADEDSTHAEGAQNSTPPSQLVKKRWLEKVHVLPIGNKAADREVFAALKKMMADDVLLQQYMAFEVPVTLANCPTSGASVDAGERSKVETSKEPEPEADTLPACTYIVVECCPRSGYVGRDTLVFLAGQPLQPLRRVQLLALVHPNSSYARRAGIHSYQQLFDQAPSFPSLDRQEPSVEDSAPVYTLSSMVHSSPAASTQPVGQLLSPFTPAFFDDRQAASDDGFPFGFTDIIEELESVSSSTSTSDEETERLGERHSHGFSLRGPTVPRPASRGDVTEVGENESAECSEVEDSDRPASFESRRSASSSSTQATEGRRESGDGSGDALLKGPARGGLCVGCSRTGENHPSQTFGENWGGKARSSEAEATHTACPGHTCKADTSRGDASAAERRRFQRRRLQQHSQFFESEPRNGSSTRRGWLPGTIRVRLRERISTVQTSGERGSGVCRAGKRLERLDPETLFREFVEPHLSSRMYGPRGRKSGSTSTVVLYPGKKLVIGDLTFVVWATDPRNNPGFVDENTSIYISLDPYGEFKRVHFVPFSDTLPTTYRFDFYDDYLKPFLLENTWRNFTRGDVYSYRGVEFKLIATEPASCNIARVGPETIVHYQGSVEPTIMDLLPPDILQRIRRLPVRLQPFAIISAAQALDPQVLMRVIPAASIRGPRQGLSEQMVDVLRDRLVHPFSFAHYLHSFRDLCERKLPSGAKPDDSPCKRNASPGSSKQQAAMGTTTHDRDPQKSARGDTNITDIIQQPSGVEIERQTEQVEDDSASSTFAVRVQPESLSDALSSVSTPGHEGGPSDKRPPQEEEGNSDKSRRNLEAVQGVEANSEAPLSPDHSETAEKPAWSMCVDEFERPSCTVCTLTLEEGDLSIILPCGHVFHWQCAHAWLRCNSTCPNCRADINVLLQRDNGERSDSACASRMSSTRDRSRSDGQRTEWHRRNRGDENDRQGGIGNAFRSWFSSILS
ncbi:zinc finger, C3HC4 type (RING finger) domain-containing protein [Toxoplasma gondii GAB2-2007-GAL-DOM2]|uniref:RING-type E3 ubiquitin transferase n=3 Tax=Toxoplasma gondii TaxID=5811 RepID=A0A086KAN9_TOXGO|nr:zinc finger, C3HC4 type (RING finger) domain-containing protein [Toxoplasma gondii FOU]KFG42260.1 zinc finger, C3HC4 type (RING finger) domain-containing protein [Toxoplasma gondii GAB2-2007-GAL-DOM2]RQX73617.1 zinc finger, C3HC4 type (RING finger) domain-containing protein [Toxoplasma gondii CAST]